MAYTVTVQVGLTDSTATLAATGGAGVATTNAEAAAFGIDEDVIKAMFLKILGRACTYGGYKDPIHGTDVYGQFHQKPVTTEFRTTRASITNVASTTATVASQTCDNSAGTAPVSFDPQLSAFVANTIDSAMSPDGATVLAEPVAYDISFAGTGGSGPFGYTFDQPWAPNFHLVSPNTYDMAPAEPIIVPAGSSTTASIVATVGTMTIEIDYALDLSGLFAGLYDPPIDKHHVMFDDATTGLRSLDMATEITATQTLTIVFYTDPELQVTTD